MFFMWRKVGVRLEEANDFKGMGNYVTRERLQEKHGSHIGIISVGPAGEMLMSAASIAITDKDGIPCRFAPRGGLGAVMGSKGIKAIILDDNNPHDWFSSFPCGMYSIFMPPFGRRTSHPCLQIGVFKF